MMPSRAERPGPRLARLALLLALGLILGRLEAMLPPLPVPGAKLGLGNLATLAALACEGMWPALALTLTRCLAGGLFGGAFSTLYSLAGALLAWCAMVAALRIRGVSLIGASALGAAAHHMGQLAVASLLLGSGTVWRYLPALILAAIVSGMLTGWTCAVCLRALLQAQLMAVRDPGWIML